MLKARIAGDRLEEGGFEGDIAALQLLQWRRPDRQEGRTLRHKSRRAFAKSKPAVQRICLHGKSVSGVERHHIRQRMV